MLGKAQHKDHQHGHQRGIQRGPPHEQVHAGEQRSRQGTPERVQRPQHGADAEVGIQPLGPAAQVQEQHGQPQAADHAGHHHRSGDHQDDFAVVHALHCLALAETGLRQADPLTAGEHHVDRVQARLQGIRRHVDQQQRPCPVRLRRRSLTQVIEQQMAVKRDARVRQQARKVQRLRPRCNAQLSL